ncbi:MAG: GNAT family N-acetyltransferase [Jatrophihabitans sp.]
MTGHAEIRHVPAEEMLPWLRSMRTTLLVDPGALSDAGQRWWNKVWDADRIFGGYADGRCVATLRTFATTVSVPSGAGDCAEIATDALTQVTVAGTHRRRGLLTGMLTRSLRDAKDRGELVSLLRAAEWPIYSRFGYWPATFGSNYTIRSGQHLNILAPQRPVEVVQVEPAELLAPAAAVFARIRRQRAGHIDREPAVWERRLGLQDMKPPNTREPVCVIARNGEGGVDGYATWTANEGDWFHDPQQAQAVVSEVLAATPDAYRALWRYLIGIDLVRSLSLEAYPVDEPLEWLLSDGRAARRTWTGDNDWLRLLDVPAVLSARRYQSTDRLVLQVVDTDGGWAAGRVSLDGGPEHADCRAGTTESADLTLSQRALAAIYLGGCTVRSQPLAGLLDEETPGAASRLEAMFRTSQAPWNATPF